jgi:hypothetical protein
VTLSKKRNEVHPELQVIRKYVLRNHLSSSDMELAYNIAFNKDEVKNLAKNSPSYKVYELADIVRKKVEKGMPKSQFKKMIKRWKRHDSAEKDFEALVQSLITTDTEKELLRSIVKKCLCGRLEIMHITTDELVLVRIPRQKYKPTSKDVACGLFVFCEHLKGKVVKVRFKEGSV